METQEQTVILATYGVLYSNELALCCINDIKDYVPKDDKEAQKLLRAIKKRTKKYEHMISDILNTIMGTYVEFMDRMDEICMKKANAYRIIVQQHFKYRGIRNYKEASFIEAALDITNLSVIINKTTIEKVSKINRDALSLQIYTLEEICPILEQLLNWTTRKDKDIEVDLNSDENVIKVFNDLQKNVFNFYNISRCLKKI